MSKDINTMLNAVSKKLGCSPEELAERLQNGDVSSVLGGMSREGQQRFNSIISDKDALERFVNSPKTQALIKKLGGK